MYIKFKNYDLIYDTVGILSFTECRDALTSSGSCVSLVLGIRLLWSMATTSLFSKKKAKFSMTGRLSLQEKMRLLAILIDIIDAGHLKPVVDRPYPLEDIVEARTNIETGHKIGNVVLKPIDR